MKLTGDHNQCCSCMRLFNSGAAFDKHRVGDFSHKDKKPSPYGPIRRCMSEDEMREVGMDKNGVGWWVTARNTRFARAA